MNLELKGIYPDGVDLERVDSRGFVVPLRVEIGEKGKKGAEVFHFVAASARGLSLEVIEGEFRLLRGYILLDEFDLDIVRKALQNLIDRARSLGNWNQVVSFLNRYGRYDSEDLDGVHGP
jgi:hypothetical protein